MTKQRKCRSCDKPLPFNRYFKCENCLSKIVLENSDDGDLIYYQLLDEDIEKEKNSLE